MFVDRAGHLVRIHFLTRSADYSLHTEASLILDKPLAEASRGLSAIAGLLCIITRHITFSASSVLDVRKLFRNTRVKDVSASWRRLC